MSFFGRLAPMVLVLAVASAELTGVAGAGDQVTAQAGGVPAYSALPATPLPGNMGSVGFEALGLSEFGDYVGLAETGDLDSLDVVMSAQACENRPGGVCQTTPGATFPVSITANLYGWTKAPPPSRSERSSPLPP
jgi:hypothetical protein